MLKLRQTKNGCYNSTPDVEDVLEELGYCTSECICDDRDGEWGNPYCRVCNCTWSKGYSDRGHGEYISNVLIIAKEYKEKYPTDVVIDLAAKRVARSIKNAEWEWEGW